MFVLECVRRIVCKALTVLSCQKLGRTNQTLLAGWMLLIQRVDFVGSRHQALNPGKHPTAASDLQIHHIRGKVSLSN